MFIKALGTSASALTANRMRMDIIAENLANQTVTRTANGQPYRRRNAVLASADTGRMTTFSGMLKRNSNIVNAEMGVKVQRIIEDQSPFKLQYDPTHPDADANGYVRLPNVDTLREQVDLLAVSRSYEANITAFNVTKAIANKALEIGR